jgi:hypothetical protein
MEGAPRSGGTSIVNLPETGVETMLIDLEDVPLSAVAACDTDAWSGSVSMVLAQVDRPRKNIGGSGPPGRVD